jgi:hypothetical protein
MGGALCGVSTGEALSRWCAASVGDNALSDFATAPYWFSHGAPDFVNRVDPTDGDAASTGCGMAFISWLLSRNIALAAVAQALVALGAGGTFADLYGQLTHADPKGAWPAFMAAVHGLSGGVTSDDPFAAMGAARPAPAASRPRSHRLLPPQP